MFGKKSDCISRPPGKFRPPVSDKVDEELDLHVPTVSCSRCCLEHPFPLLLPMTSGLGEASIETGAREIMPVLEHPSPIR
ncbi:MAG: hypothetical protein CMJ67_00520 [Planctomycetaceae bacterium]|nr:hypothetical protein [Planctomycetaceae bacterium]